eukprot:6536516-Prymnesium_polylepis.1
MSRTPLSKKKSSDRRKSAVGHGALEGVKKSIARKRRSLLELSSTVTSGLLQSSAPYEDFVPFAPPSPEAAPPAAPAQTALTTEVKQNAPPAAAVLSEVAARVKHNVREASVKGKAVVATAAARVKENVIESVQEVTAGMREAAKIQWRSEMKKEVLSLQVCARSGESAAIDGAEWRRNPTVAHALDPFHRASFSGVRL